MADNALAQRLEGMRRILMSVHEAGAQLPSAVKGLERENFVDYFLREVFPPAYRFGTGAIIDQSGVSTGQMDIVIEYPFFPSLPVGSGRATRLYMVEGVAAVIEVKSDLKGQWKEVVGTANNLSKIKRNFGSGITRVGDLDRVPFFVVGFEGWRKKQTILAKLESIPVDGILVINNGIFVSRGDVNYYTKKPWGALLGIIDCIQKATTSVLITSTSLRDYVQLAPAQSR